MPDNRPTPDFPISSDAELERELDRALAMASEAADAALERGDLAPEKIAAAIKEFRAEHPYRLEGRTVNVDRQADLPTPSALIAGPADGTLAIGGLAEDLRGVRRAWEGRTVSEPEKINHPSHYNASPSGVECITVVEHMNFCIGNAIKYLWRAGLKGDAIEDLEKASWYVARELERQRKFVVQDDRKV